MKIIAYVNAPSYASKYLTKPLNYGKGSGIQTT